MTERTEYKGRPILVLKNKEDDKYPFSFGAGKAKLILANIKDIEQFVKEQEKTQA